MMIMCSPGVWISNLETMPLAYIQFSQFLALRIFENYQKYSFSFNLPILYISHSLLFFFPIYFTHSHIICLLVGLNFIFCFFFITHNIISSQIVVNKQQYQQQKQISMDQPYNDKKDLTKIIQESLTQDTQSVLMGTDSNAHFLAEKVGYLFQCAWGRVFLAKVKACNKQKIKDRSNLALILAERMPPSIKDQVTKIVRYYEEHMQDQLHQIHSLVQENSKLKKIAESKEEESNKQNKPMQKQSVPIKNERVSELEITLMQKNKQIVNLNKEITDLLCKVKKYKKRVYQLQAKSPIKTISEFQ